MKRIALLIGLAAGTFATGVDAAERRMITIGTGGVAGVYYPAGGAICRLLNQGRRDHGLRCAAESTEGSVQDIRRLRQGELEFGLVQSDVQADAVNGRGVFAESGPERDLRAVFSIHAEPLHLMARADSGIDSIAGLSGRSVAIGAPGSGTRVLAEKLLEAVGLAVSDLAAAAEIGTDDQAAALCDGTIDAAIFVAGAPNASASEAASTCAIRLVAVAGPAAEKAFGGDPAYGRATIPGGLYDGNPGDTPSWGPRATLVTDAAASEEEVHALVRAVFENIETFRSLHPAFSRLEPEAMIREGLSAELHSGAVRYYREQGWK